MKSASMISSQQLRKNVILSALGPQSEALVLQRGESMNLALRQEIYASEQEIRDVYFPIDAVLSVVALMLGQLAACNRLHSIYERCARWLLMTRDRVDGDDIPLTQEFLAMMLGTGRSGVAIAASTFQQAGFIKYSHGIIRMLDRPGLENAACECYEVAREQFGGLLREVAPTDSRAAAIRELGIKRKRLDERPEL